MLYSKKDSSAKRKAEVIAQLLVMLNQYILHYISLRNITNLRFQGIGKLENELNKEEPLVEDSDSQPRKSTLRRRTVV